MPTQTTGTPRLRAFSAKTTGNRPLPASSPTGSRGPAAWRRDVAETSAMATASLPGLLVGPAVVAEAEVLLDAAQVAAHVGELLQAHEDALLLALRRRRGAEVALAGRHVLGDAGLGADQHAVADADVVHDADLAGHHDVVAGAARPGDAHLADEQVVPADLTVVGHLHEVVDLGSLADAGRLEGAAVDGGAGADLDVVAQLNVAELRHLDVPAVVEAVAEAVGPEDGVGVDDDPVA